MLFKNIRLIDENLADKENMFVGVIGDRIQYIGNKMPENAADFGRIYDGKNKILMNGLFNAHGHSPMTLLRGYAENLNLQDWLFNRIFPFEAKITNEDSYYATTLAIAEMMASGTVSVSDMYAHMDSNIRAYLDSGFKANVTNGLMAFDDTPFLKNRNHLEEEECTKTYHGAGNGRIKIDKSCHAVYTSNRKTVEALAEFAKENDRIVHIHLAETETEVKECIEKYGVTPTKYFSDAGLLDCHTIAAHCVWLSDEDMDILSEKKTIAVHNSVSNLKLASGVANVPKMLEKGIKIALGTDGCSSNNNLDMFEEIKLCAILNKGVRCDPMAVSPRDALLFATKNGAAAQRREDCGAVTLGNKADLIVLDASQPSLQPVHSAVNNAVYAACGRDVALTMIDGKVVYENGEFKTIDIERTIFEVCKSKDRIAGELSI